MEKIITPALWLIILIIGLPQFAETVYTPSLPDIAAGLRTSASMIEHTLTIYLFGFAVGVLFWGKISDVFGRKPCVLVGLLIFIAGSLSCYFSSSIDMLMISRFIQSFGGSVGSVLGMAILRDSFSGKELGKFSSSIGAGLAVGPAIGPVIGGFISEHYHWSNIFLFLVIIAAIIVTIILLRLPETHGKSKRQLLSTPSIIDVAWKMLRDKKVIGFICIIGAANGLCFSYFSEGSFYLIDLLGLSPSRYGMTFILTSIFAMCGSLTSRKLHNHHSAGDIMKYGLLIIFLSTLIFSVIVTANYIISPVNQYALICITISAQMMIMFGLSMLLANAFALALVDYNWAIGTSSSLFSFFYYLIGSLFMFLMGVLHNGSLLPMPLYFLALSVFMIIINKLFVKIELPA